MNLPADDDPRLVLVTAPPGAPAAELARALVTERLAACVNVLGGVTSVYRWEGAVQSDAEALLLIKTRADRLAALEARVGELHPYDVPEFVVLEPAHVEARYRAWLAAEAGD